ncbi:hypothetical protein GQ43DRAFT_110514 [Delitschia confertaspora ATCC 74209]|uniref:Uncharacterized protein n=1 Tax=Delitschia confertaspora ATCC 74209 TaxID=1513339 RepID=A0A9P4JT71_9PLEO|nr:hypothetical protein GQ43DRAFT_110514 [Delitschia confertaspora ATCC 74209]
MTKTCDMNDDGLKNILTGLQAEMPNLRRFPVPAPSLTARRFASSENRRAAQWSSTVPGYTTIGAPPLKKGMRLSSLPPHPSKLGPSTLPNDHRADKSGLVPSMAPTTDRPSQSRDNSTDWEFSSDVRNYLKAHPEVVEGSRPPALTSSSRVAFKRATTKEKMDGIFGWNWKSCAGPEGPDQYSHWVPITAASPTAGVSDRRQLVPHSGTPTSVSAGHKESPVAIVADFFDKNRDTVEGSSVVPTHGPDTPSLNAWAPSPLGGRRSNLSPSPTNNRSDIHNISSRMPQRSSPPNPACNPYYNGPLGGHRADSLRSIDRRYTANPLGSDASLKKFNQEPEPPSPARNPNYRGPPEGYSKDYLLSFKNIYTEKLPGWDEMLKELHNEAPSGLNVPEVVVSGPSPQISHAVPVESPPSPAINSLHSVTFRGPFYGHHGASFSDPFIDRHSQTPPSRYPQTVPCPSGAPYSPAALYPPYSRPTRPSRLPLFMDNEYLTHLAIHNTRPGRPDRPTPPLHTSSNTPPSPSPLNNPTFFEHVAAASLGTGCDVDQPFPRLALPVAHRFLARPPHRGVPPQVQMMLESRIPARDAWIRRKATEIATAGRECRAAETVYQNSGSLEDYQIWQERKRRVVEMTDLEGILVERRALFMSQDWRVMRDSRGNVLRGFEAVFERTIAQQHMQA